MIKIPLTPPPVSMIKETTETPFPACSARFLPVNCKSFAVLGGHFPQKTRLCGIKFTLAVHFDKIILTFQGRIDNIRLEYSVSPAFRHQRSLFAGASHPGDEQCKWKDDL